MKKKEAEQYFNQLKKIDKQGSMRLPDLINILTGGDIAIKDYQRFITYLSSNQFGEYNFIDEDIDRKDWREFTFAKVYQLLKAIKNYLRKDRQGSKSNKQVSLISNQQSKQKISEKDSTVVDLIGNLKSTEASTHEVKKDIYEEKWKSQKIKVLKKLLIVFDYYRKAMHDHNNTFEKNQELTQYFNLTMFMKYFKDMQLSSAFELTRIIKHYKRHATNTIWIDFDKFLAIHLSLISLKEGLGNEEKYLKLRGLNELISSEKIKKILNVRRQHAVSTIVSGHTGVYKDDIVNYLQQKSKQRKKRIQLKWSSKSLPVKKVRKQPVDTSPKVRQHRSDKYLRIKTQGSPSIYQQLKLPKLRLKQHRNQSIYESLRALDLSQYHKKLQDVLDLSPNYQYLEEYHNQESKLKDKKKKHPSKFQFQLPPMKFT